MNTYDPMAGWTYRHIDGRADQYDAPATPSAGVDRLPSGYANSSPVISLDPQHRPVGTQKPDPVDPKVPSTGTTGTARAPHPRVGHRTAVRRGHPPRRRSPRGAGCLG